MDPVTGVPWSRGTAVRPGLGFRPRLPLRREATGSSDQSVVIIAPPNSPEVEVTVGPLTSTPTERTAPTAIPWQLDGLTNPALQPDLEDEVACAQPEAVDPVGDTISPDNTPPLPDSDPEEPITVSFSNYHWHMGGCVLRFFVLLY